MAVTFLYTSFSGIDGKPGLSVEDVAENYYGNGSGTRLESTMRDPMASYFTKWDPHYTYIVVISGALLGLAWATQLGISVYQIWFLKCRTETENEDLNL